jgi:hypothetical protein
MNIEEGIICRIFVRASTNVMININAMLVQIAA